MSTRAVETPLSFALEAPSATATHAIPRLESVNWMSSLALPLTHARSLSALKHPDAKSLIRTVLILTLALLTLAVLTAPASTTGTQCVWLAIMKLALGTTIAAPRSAAAVPALLPPFHVTTTTRALMTRATCTSTALPTAPITHTSATPPIFATQLCVML